MYKYTIYTEDVNRVETENYLNEVLPSGYTILNARGHYQRKSENTLKIEILQFTAEDTAIKDTCEMIKRLNRQQSVLYTKEKIEGYFV